MIHGTYTETRKERFRTVIRLEDVHDTGPKDLMRWRPGLSVIESGLI
jgi:hypothetical protein